MKGRVVAITLLLHFIGIQLAAQDTVRVQLKWWDQFQFAGFYAAQLQGFYKAEGLEVELVPGNGKISPVAEVTSGRAQFGISGSDLLLDYEKGEPVQVLGVIFQHSPYVFMSLPESAIRTPADLVGRKVMVSQTQGWVQLEAMMLREGISPDSVHILPHSWNNNDLITGKTDAISAYSSVEPYQLRAKGYDPVLLYPSTYGIDFYGDVLFTSRRLAQEQPELAERFRRATFKGWSYAMDHEEELVNYLLSLSSVKARGVTRQELLQEAHEMETLMSSNLVEPGHMNSARWEHILSTYKELHLVPESASLDGFLYEPGKSFYDEHEKLVDIAAVSLVSLMVLLMINSVAMRKLVRRKTRQLETEMQEKLKAQTELEKSREMLALAAGAVAIGCWDWNPGTGQLNVDDHWLQLFGYRRDEVQPSAVWFAGQVHPDDLHELNEKSVVLLQEPDYSLSSIHRMRTAAGEWKWVLSNSKGVEKNNDGRFTRIVGITVDMSQVKQKEKELLVLTRELMHTNRELQQFAYVTSHNLRAPVVNIISLLRFINVEQLRPDERDLLSKISTCAYSLHDTLDELNMLLTNAFPAADTANDTVRFSERLALLQNNISEFIRTSGATIEADFSRLPSMPYPQKIFDSILLNLISNAIKYRHPSRQPQIRIRTDEDKTYYILEISDNGLGIDLSRESGRIFRLYQRFHEGIEGKGIGLYLVRSQVEALDGRITVNSSPGTGTVFTVYFNKNRFSGVL